MKGLISAGLLLLLIVTTGYMYSSEVAKVSTNWWAYDANRWAPQYSEWVELRHPQVNFYTEDAYKVRDEGIAFSFKTRPRNDSIYKVVYSCTADDEVSIYAFDNGYYYRSSEEHGGTLIVCVTNGKVQVVCNSVILERVPRHSFKMKTTSMFSFNLTEL